MKKISVFLLLLLISAFFLHVSNIQATQFSSAYLRLDRLEANTPLSGQVCTKPSSPGAGIEAKISITFPSDFTISTNASNWTTNTSNLPSGAVAWTSIGAAASDVTGKVVTFSGGNLTNGSSLYCFNFTAASSTTGSTGAKTGFVISKNSSGATIDSTEYGLTIVNNDQVTVSATVSADPDDFENELAILTAGTTFNQNKELEYQVTYGSNLAYATSLTVIVQWSLGTISGDSTPIVGILDYVAGSATNAYGTTPPVIDTVNRTITWSISSFPAATTGQTVNFKLKTNNSYTSSPTVSFTVSSHLEPPGVTTTDSDVTRTYQYDAGTTTTTAGPTPTPTPAPAKNMFANVQVRTIDSSSASIFVQVLNYSVLSISYGTSINNLFSQVKLSGLRKSGLFSLKNINNDTKYFYQIIAKEEDGTRIKSDIYTLTTATPSDKPLIDKNSFIAIAEDAILAYIKSFGIDEEIIDTKKIVIPKNTPFKIKFALLEYAQIVSATAIVRDKKTLGIQASAAQLTSNKIELVEVEPGIFLGGLNSGAFEGKYEIYIRLRDVFGNITEEKISDLRTIERFKVFSKSANRPIEGARVLFSIFNPSSKTYLKIPSQSISNGNPSFTDRNGELNTVFPQANYRAEVSSIKYKKQIVEFHISYDKGDGFPTVYLKDARPGIFGYMNYYLSILNEVFFTQTQAYFQNLTGSLRFFDLMVFITLGTLVFLTFLAFSKRYHIPLSSMHSYFYYLLDHKSRHEKYITGVVFDESDKGVPSANVYIADAQDEKIVGQVKTNKRGEFFWKKRVEKSYLVMVMAKEYKSTQFLEFKEKDHLKFKVTLEKTHEGLNLVENAGYFISRGFGMTFEVLIIVTIIFQILFINHFGIIRTLPFLIISIINFVLWILLIHHHRNHYK